MFRPEQAAAQASFNKALQVIDMLKHLRADDHVKGFSTPLAKKLAYGLSFL